MSWLRQLAVDMRNVQRTLGLLTDVEIERRNDTVDARTGERGFDARVDGEARINAMDVRRFGNERLLDDAKHQLLLFDQQVSEGDRVWWDGAAHDVVEVTGVHASSGGRYYVACVTN